MAIKFDNATRTFQLDTAGTSYIFCVFEEGFLGHVYYGKKIRQQAAPQLLRAGEYPFSPAVFPRDRVPFLDCFPTEFSGHAVGDFRESCIAVRTAGGYSSVMPLYESHEILDEKPALCNLPSSFAGDDKVQTLVVHMEDKCIGLKVDLIYSVFEKEDVITRSVNVRNEGEPLYLTKIMSACIDMDADDFDVLTLHGSWGRERHIVRRPITYGKQSVGSVRGVSSHQENPFIAWMSKGTDQTRGQVYAMNFVYSGNFLAQIEKPQYGVIRAVMGIHPDDFAWKLETGDVFTAPEVVITYSDDGLGGMTANFHDFYRNHLIRGKYAHTMRPILINNWEGTYFDFDTEKLISIAKKASECGIEMLVMDDGWFGHRNMDDSSLGDWYVNEEKLPGGLKYLVDEVNKLGMKFGLWIEPEMVSPDSDLYRAHPDWAIRVPGREPGLGRHQLVLDIGRKEVRDTIYGMISKVLSSANIEYVKWDMNRQLADLGSADLPADRQGELFHRYALGVYDMMERMVSDFPNILFENCSSGGARFDPGMLYYSPQIWCSDDTDAIERLSIQEGTALVYPLSTMGAHVSACPNHMLCRTTPFTTRGNVALAGTFGYELDVTKLTDEDVAMISEQVDTYHKYNDIIREGDYYRIASYKENRLFDCWMVVAKDKSEALVTFVQVMGQPNLKAHKLKLRGLDPSADYLAEIEMEGEKGVDGGYENGAPVPYTPDKKVFGGDLLMEAGLLLPRPLGDFKSMLIHLSAVK